MSMDWIQELQLALTSGRPCALLTVAATRGSVPRQSGTKMIVFEDGSISGTIGGGKFESLVVADAVKTIRERTVVLKTYPLHEGEQDSFGAICGGESTILFEPQAAPATLVLVGAGHCSQAIARLALECGWRVVVLDDRTEFESGKGVNLVSDQSPAEYISAHQWRLEDALVMVSRNFEIDRDALAAALACPDIGYLGMIGSQRKVRRVFEELTAAGANVARLSEVHAPLGLDIGADSPSEIAVSVMAEILKVTRGRSGLSFRDTTAGPV